MAVNLKGGGFRHQGATQILRPSRHIVGAPKPVCMIVLVTSRSFQRFWKFSKILKF